ncbi:LLM class F420-dependent oxidoreductase [Saccharomonospora sp. NPDC046836]|uniref:LLM class F420-dependent oxidoreductase n=1 Tax=Saccharomonospora sp. NPDC046836 TaxID=3156921 RepID=UPI0033CC1259
MGLDVRNDLPATEQLDLCAWADDNGFADAWMAEITDPEIFAMMGAATQRTSRIRLGTAIVPLGPRSLPTVASGAATIAALAPGRLCLGLGVSSRVIVEAWHGGDFGAPIARARESVSALRDMLVGWRSDHHGDHVRSVGFQLKHVPDSMPEIALAALNPQMLRLAGEVADAVHLNFVPVDAVATVLDQVRRGAQAVKRPMPEVVLAVPTWVTEDCDAARAELASALAFYLTAPSYQKALTWYGFAAEVEALRSVYASKGLSAVPGIISPAMLDAIGAWGTVSQVRDRYQEYWEAGVSSLSISALGPHPMDTFAALVPPGRSDVG